MIYWIIWLSAYLCPNPNHTPELHGNCSLVHLPGMAQTSDGDDDLGGGETGNFPPFPPPPPPPPPK
ncbi:MAG: hypothetical protein NVV59_17820 [Chitinophagaceae bacterium]|nr:hypothetical protein [Chitinophagaceae bacterium]